MGKCKFSDVWLDEPRFKDWLRPVVGNNREAFCHVCKKTINILCMGLNAIKSHMESANHQRRMHRRGEQLPISMFCGTSQTSTATALPSTALPTRATASSFPNDSIVNRCSDARQQQTQCPVTTAATLRAEVLWCLDLVTKHHSFNSNEGIGELFRNMFPDSDIAKSFALGKDKTAYFIKFGIAPCFKRQLVKTINKAGPFVLMFDESLNQSSKKTQMDIHIRFLEDGCVRSRYFGSEFLGHATADDLLQHIKECVAQLNMRQLLSVGMDGPNVNFKFLDLLQKEHAELHGGAQVIMVGSCGLHTLHNAMKAGFTAWQLEKLLRAMHFLFHNVPARREDFTKLTSSSCFPLSFCGHRWVENVPVAERAIEIWPMIQKYVDAAEDKRVQKPSTASYDAILAARGDPFIIPKLEFFLSIARSFNPFLQKYQTDEPVLPFLAKDLTELLMSLLRRFIKRELLHDRRPLQLIKMDISEEKSWVSLKSLDIGLGAESAVKALQGKTGSKIGELSVLNFRRECLQCLVKVVRKLQEKCPLKFPVVRQIACLDPTRMNRDPEWCITQMKNLVQTFIQGKQLAGGIAAGDVVIQQFVSFLSDAREEDFVSFQPLRQRLDVFLHSKLHKSHPDLLRFCLSVLLLSHGQATVERGFSVNKEVESCNLLDDSLEALRLVCDEVIACGGILKVPLTKELLASAATARSQYRLYLDSERKKKESATQELKRKEAEKELEDLRNQRRVLITVCDSLEVDADKFAEMAEGKAGTKMAELITKSNSLRRRHKDKKAELIQLDKMIEEKAKQLRHL